MTRARPDFVYWLSPGRGVLGEVERGGTTTNNHDLKDMWKAHTHRILSTSFLLCLEANWGESGRAASALPTRGPAAFAAGTIAASWMWSVFMSSATDRWNR